jgi:hypothetical protein
MIRVHYFLIAAAENTDLVLGLEDIYRLATSRPLNELVYIS